jgi:hypothetical protein
MPTRDGVIFRYMTDGQDDRVNKSRNVKRVLITGMSGAGKR